MRSRALVPQHLAEVRARRLAEIDKVEREVRARLIREINYWDARAARLREEERAGKEQRINASNAEATAQRLVERLHRRQAELDRERQITRPAAAPQGRGAGHPARAARRAMPQPAETAAAAGFAEDPLARAEIERLAMAAVMAAERRLGHEPRDVSAEKKGWDIESRDGATGHLRFIEVKGRHADGARRDPDQERDPGLAERARGLHPGHRHDRGGNAHEPVYVRRSAVPRAWLRRDAGGSTTSMICYRSDASRQLTAEGGDPSEIEAPGLMRTDLATCSEPTCSSASR